MSTHKTVIDQEFVFSFLKDTFSKNVSGLEVIHGGEGSQAYSFSVLEDAYIIRINRHSNNGFKKDEHAFKHFVSAAFPIPEIYKIGEIKSVAGSVTPFFYCISKKVDGVTIDKLDSEKNLSILPQLFQTLDAIHGVDVSHTKGYGSWAIDGKTENATWKGHILDVDRWAKGGEGKPNLFDTTFLEKVFWDKAYTKLAELVNYCPEDRWLVHADYGFNNVLSDGRKITGVIDWENSKYGDFLFDIGWLAFWSFNIDYQKLYGEHAEKQGRQISNYAERVLCYKIFIGLSSMSFFAYSNQRDKYDFAKGVVKKLYE